MPVSPFPAERTASAELDLAESGRAFERRRTLLESVVPRALPAAGPPLFVLLSSLPAVTLVFAHPDDESIALGSRLQQFASVHLLHATDGAPRDGSDAHAHGFWTPEQYSAARFAELGHALEVAGVPEMVRSCLGFPDQQAAMHLPELTLALLRCFEQQGTAAVLTHPYEGGHPDHDACAFAVHAAAALLRRQSRPAPTVVEAAFYHAGPEGILTGRFLAHPTGGPEELLCLNAVESERKHAVLQCFHSQRETLGYFGVAEERFRIAPAYHFTQPPTHTIFYERFGWGMTADRFCDLASDALGTLGLEPGDLCP